MIGVDTNILVRYLTQDDPAQASAATDLLESRISTQQHGYVSQVVLTELVWVLDRGYRYAKADIIRAVSGLLSVRELTIEKADEAWAALQQFETGQADFADYLIGLSGRLAGCTTTFTFDRRAARSARHTVLDY
ncbi:type II toxin-antitoxin system VapC family toxin [Wenzhouxiangella sp. AB-CW3]|uniref:PIN domain-containing protein n=1 Tax=Wenzhouxiangella sp. AB-CW3 TaxID=2771012 RepID=UPI00168BBB3E|nr:type II toxin-antitoxin system VapC family toxin [Wenzhouxiangella sp. AB-CW3]QOC23304.1 type II toxin-antitoxin system VapC family toxin [Wenzhouxiangella sp. AB-CW3]